MIVHTVGLYLSLTALLFMNQQFTNKYALRN